ncbi:MAG: hypothetical protein KA004_14755 [Verrucomicrobiales bacterium]|nr:hypothetical protein [Verrucomicrobiales bacterium]
MNKKAKVQEQVPAEFAQPKLDDNGVPLKNPDGSHILEPVTALRLCRWHSAFGWRVQQGDPPNNAFSAFNQGFYSSDPDRFHIRVIGKDPGNKVKIATSGLNEIKVWQNGAWVEVGSDAEDEITMTKPDPAKDEWISAPLLLLDGDDDATYNPGPDDNQPEDKTHAAGLDATVAVTFPAVKDVQVKATTEKAAFRVRMKVFFLEEFEDSKRQQWANATQFARDVYRPHRLEFEFENPNLLSGSAIEAMLINEDGRKKLDLSTDAKLNDFGAAMVAAGATTDSLTVLLLPLVTGIKTSLIAGHHAVGVTWSYIWNDNGTQKIQYWVALAMFDYRPSVLAHEVGHALGLKHLTKWDSAHLLMAGTAPLPGELTRGPETMPKRLYFDPQNAADMESNESARILWNAKTLPFCQKR